MNDILALPKHSFFCDNNDHVKQAILYALDKRERTAVFCFKDIAVKFDKMDLQDYADGLLEFHSVKTGEVFTSLPFVIAASRTATPDTILACRCMHSADVQIHMFSNCVQYRYANRSDMTFHTDTQANADYIEAESCPLIASILMRTVPKDLKSDKVVKWNYSNVMRKLNDTDKSYLLRCFKAESFEKLP